MDNDTPVFIPLGRESGTGNPDGLLDKSRVRRPLLLLNDSWGTG